MFCVLLLSLIRCRFSINILKRHIHTHVFDRCIKKGKDSLCSVMCFMDLQRWELYASYRYFDTNLPFSFLFKITGIKQILNLFLLKAKISIAIMCVGILTLYTFLELSGSLFVYNESKPWNINSYILKENSKWKAASLLPLHICQTQLHLAEKRELAFAS